MRGRAYFEDMKVAKERETIFSDDSDGRNISVLCITLVRASCYDRRIAYC